MYVFKQIKFGHVTNMRASFDDNKRIITGAELLRKRSRASGKAPALRFGDGTPVIHLKYTGISHGARCEEMQKQQLLC